MWGSYLRFKDNRVLWASRINPMRSKGFWEIVLEHIRRALYVRRHVQPVLAIGNLIERIWTVTRIRSRILNKDGLLSININGAIDDTGCAVQILHLIGQINIVVHYVVHRCWLIRISLLEILAARFYTRLGLVHFWTISRLRIFRLLIIWDSAPARCWCLPLINWLRSYHLDLGLVSFNDLRQGTFELLLI